MFSHRAALRSEALGETQRGQMSLGGKPGREAADAASSPGPAGGFCSPLAFPPSGIPEPGGRRHLIALTEAGTSLRSDGC